MAPKIEYLKALFPGINFKVRSKISEEIESIFEEETQQRGIFDNTSKEDLSRVLKMLEDQLRKAKRELRDAKRGYKSGSLSSEELADFQYYVFEIQSQIEQIKSNFK